MADFLHPGVYVTESKAGANPVEPVGTTTAAFVGYSKRGEIGKAHYVTSWTDFVNKFGYGLDSPFVSSANLAYSVYGYFQNGGSTAYVVRVGDANAKKATGKITDGQATPLDVLVVTATDEGVFGNDVTYKLTKLAVTVPQFYDFTVMYKGAVQATYSKVTLDSNRDDFIEYVVNGTDKFVSVLAYNRVPAAASLGVNLTLTTGNDGLSAVGDSQLIAGLDVLKPVANNIALLVVPESQSAAVNQAAMAFAEQQSMFYIADGLQTANETTIQTERDNYNSEYGALYFPWIKVADPISKALDKTRFVPVGGHVAGVMVRTDTLRGVHKAPAGLEADIVGALETKVAITDAVQDLLNPKGINVVRAFPNAGIVIWGARTCSASANLRYINVRRSLLLIRDSIKQGTAWAVFEPNNETLWSKLATSASSFLRLQYDRGMFRGNLSQAFFVKCDGELNPQAEVDAGRVNMKIGVSVTKPGEFIIIDISQRQ